ncbi:ATP-grasp domain-containing protein [Pseudoalteromonas sp. NC201]|uniref:ATP-grasp domain-containing protein n=1 Tax=Pseudoalteromonas sp. NC201 TaxID=1514074 RepID=UPI000C7BC847|nr:hypothetical protein [Pseudoalteromonas sp. NC201]AUJ68896.1 RimK-like ATP-grasp domain protein [Pseudoalteromonas sp. NC201]
MKIAIHHRKGSFSERWIDYCEKNNVSYKVVNAFESNVIEQIKGCAAFMWHHHHGDAKDVIAAKKILFALEHAGIKVFPNFRTGWHFDDKVAQKYLFEAIGAPVVPSYVFYDKANALAWAKSINYPKVFKLKGGAGSANVRLINNKREAYKVINKSFGRGFSQFDKLNNLKDKLAKYLSKQESGKELLKAFAKLFISSSFARKHHRESGYVYFQDFIENNDSDLRVIVIDNKAFAVKRMVREGDFRASGSGVKVFDKESIDINCIKIAFEVNERLCSQSAAFDFIWDNNGKPYLVEVSYGFAIDFYDPCPGYWDNNLQWQIGEFNPQEWMVESLIDSLNNNEARDN